MVRTIKPSKCHKCKAEGEERQSSVQCGGRMFVAWLERGRESGGGKGAGPATHLPPIQNNYDGRRQGRRQKRGGVHNKQASKQEAGEEERGGSAGRPPSPLPACPPLASCPLACLPGWHAHNKMGGERECGGNNQANKQAS